FRAAEAGRGGLCQQRDGSLHRARDRRRGRRRGPARARVAEIRVVQIARQPLKNILARGAEAALGEYRQWRKGRAADEVINENQMNRIGYDLLGLKRIKDAIEVFKLNVEDYPQSANTWDSLGEAYMTSGEKEQAIKNYQRSVELNPNNTNGVEALKKLRETKEN